MNLKKALALSAAITAVGIGGSASTLANQSSDRDRDRGGFVAPCSLEGVNPAYHPEIFGSPASAAQFGFVQGPGGGWRVRPGCRR